MEISKRLVLGVSEYTLTGKGEDLHSALMDLGKASIYDIKACGLCESPLIRLSAYVTEKDKFKYIKVSCAKCKASLTLGESKQDHANYYRKNDAGKLDWQPFKGEEVKTEQKPKTSTEVIWD